MIFRRKPSGPLMRVDIVIQGMIGPRYLSVVEAVDLPEGSAVRDLLTALKKSGALDADGYELVKGVRLPLSLLINGDGIAATKRDKTVLSDGDRVTILSPVAGG